MTDKGKNEGKGTLVREEPKPVDGLTKPILTRIADRVLTRATTVAERANNDLKAEQVRGTRLNKDMVEATTEYERAIERRKHVEDDIKAENIERQARVSETENRLATAKAQADVLIEEHESRKKLLRAEGAEAEERELAAQVRAKRLRRQLEQDGDQSVRGALEKKREELKTRADELEKKLNAHVMDESEEDIAIRRSLEAELADCNNAIAQIQAELDEYGD